jgi:hypothetical protein
MNQGDPVESYAIKNLGFWSVYKPDPHPEYRPTGIIFARNEQGDDWYDFREVRENFQDGSVLVYCDPADFDGNHLTQAVFWGPDQLVPLEMLVLEITGVDPNTEKVWKLFEQQTYNPTSNTITPRIVNVAFVSAAQAKTALYNAGLLERVQEIIDTNKYPPVKIFFDSANNWEKSNPYVRSIALELGLVTFDADGNEDDSGLTALFNAASKL